MNQSCKVYNLTIKDIDEFRCGLTKFSADIYYYEFGYICIGFLCIIIIISIFGRIKESYKWFFLNQAFWDIFWSFSYSCDNLIKNAFKPGLPCFYLTRIYIYPTTNLSSNFDLFMMQLLFYNTYSALFLLTTTRFLALYFPLFYKKITNGSRIFLTILIFNMFAIFFDISPIFIYLIKEKTDELVAECVIQKNLTSQVCLSQGDHLNNGWIKFYLSSFNFFDLSTNAKKPIFLLLSVVATVMLILKVTKQSKFQLKHNQKDFISSVRIVAVITLQMLVNCFTFSMEVYDKLLPVMGRVLNLKIIHSRSVFVKGTDLTGYLNLRLPEWFGGFYGLATQSSYQMIVQIRILFETFIVLFIMTGYREAIVDFFKFIYKMCRHPRRIFKHSKTIDSTQIF